MYALGEWNVLETSAPLCKLIELNLVLKFSPKVPLFEICLSSPQTSEKGFVFVKLVNEKSPLLHLFSLLPADLNHRRLLSSLPPPSFSHFQHFIHSWIPTEYLAHVKILLVPLNFYPMKTEVNHYNYFQICGHWYVDGWKVVVWG